MADRVPCPMTYAEVVDAYFIEHRAKLLDVAAFFDRLERASEPGDDVRIDALKAGLGLLVEGGPERARRLLELWSDLSTEPVEVAPGKAALGTDMSARYTPRGRSL